MLLFGGRAVVRVRVFLLNFYYGIESQKEEEIKYVATRLPVFCIKNTGFLYDITMRYNKPFPKEVMIL